MKQSCWIYRSSKKDEMYLYLAEEDNFEAVPEPLMARFGKPVWVMFLDLDARRKLARADVENVMRQLQNEGYYLQMPPDLQPDIYHGNEA
ncbi:YcgL domain-containing protein [Thiolapillus sp.]